MPNRRIYLRDLHSKPLVEWSKVERKFVVTNDGGNSMFLTNPTIHWTPTRGVYLEDLDPTVNRGRPINILYTSKSFSRLKGDRP